MQEPTVPIVRPFDPPPPPEPVVEEPKPRARWIKEEIFLMPWRLLLLVAVCWDAYYAWAGMTKPLEELQRLKVETLQNVGQFGVSLFIAAELVYYLFISWSFRRWKEWGMLIWLAGVVVLALNYNYRIE